MNQHNNNSAMPRDTLGSILMCIYFVTHAAITKDDVKYLRIILKMDHTGGAPRNSGDMFQLNSCHARTKIKTEKGDRDSMKKKLRKREREGELPCWGWGQRLVPSD
jgi:hypothetical protein